MIVHVSGVPHLAHRRVPILVVSLGVFQFGDGVLVVPRIVSVILQRLFRPVRKA